MKPSLFAAERTFPWHVRRGIGFNVKARVSGTAARVIVKRHGQEREVELSPIELRTLMSLDRFAPVQDRASCERFEAMDLLYYARGPVERATTGRPIGWLDAESVALRDGVGLTLAIEDGDEIKPWLFMPRRGMLDAQTLRGARFSSMEQGTEVYALDLYGDRKEVVALRQLLPLLDGRFSGRELVHQVGADAVAILGWLDDCALLANERPSFVEPDGDYVCWLGHAAVLVRVGGKRVLVDPIAIRRSAPPEPFIQAAFDFRRLPPVDLVVFTHGDNDHLNPPTLMRLPRDVPIVIPAPVEKKPYQVDMGEVLAFLGYTDVRTSHPLVRACAFEGEDWGLVLQKATYVIGERVYCGADSACSEETLRKVGKVDFAFLGVSGSEEPLIAPPGFGYGEFYALWLPRARRNEWQRHTDGPKDAARAAEILQAKKVFGYAAGGGSFMEMAHSDRGSHAELAALIGDRAANLALGEPFPL